jgi:hypothetical protein
MSLGASGPTIVANFVANTSKMTSEVDKATSSTGSKITSWAKGAAVAIGGAFAVSAIVDFGKASVEAAAADAEAQEKLATTIRNVTGATDKQVAATEDYIAKLSQQTAIADDDLRPAMDKLVRGFKDTEEAQKALALATDVSAGTGKDLNTVAEAMMKAANGQTGALGRLGVATKDAQGNALSLDQIMANMSKTFAGQAAKSADTAAGRMRNAKIQFGEFQEQIGAALLPVLVTLADIFMNKLLPAFKAVGSWIGDNLDVIEAIGIGLGAVGAVILASLVPAFIAWAGAAASAAAATLLAAAPFIAIGAAVAAVAYLVIHNWDTIVAATKTAWHWVQDAVMAVWDWIKTNWPLLLAIITGPIGAAVYVIVRNWDTIKAAALAVWDWLKSAWGAVADFVSAPFIAAWRVISGVWDSIKGAATSTYNFMVGVFGALGSAITAPIRLAWNALASVWNSTVGAISIKVPDFVPGIGGKGFDVPDLPHLAKGAVLTQPTLFVGGEAGRELVTPEDLLRTILREERGGASYTLNLYPRTADAGDIAYGFRRLELLAGL